jgi:hypothetical protein
LIKDASPEPSCPLIIGIGEADVRLISIMEKKEKTIAETDNSDAYDKGSLNHLFDYINYMCDHVVVVMTGNMSLDNLEKSINDPSCTKASRVHAINVKGCCSHELQITNLEKEYIGETKKGFCSYKDVYTKGKLLPLLK